MFFTRRPHRPQDSYPGRLGSRRDRTRPSWHPTRHGPRGGVRNSSAHSWILSCVPSIEDLPYCAPSSGVRPGLGAFPMEVHLASTITVDTRTRDPGDHRRDRPHAGRASTDGARGGHGATAAGARAPVGRRSGLSPSPGRSPGRRGCGRTGRLSRSASCPWRRPTRRSSSEGRSSIRRSTRGGRGAPTGRMSGAPTRRAVARAAPSSPAASATGTTTTMSSAPATALAAASRT